MHGVLTGGCAHVALLFLVFVASKIGAVQLNQQGLAERQHSSEHAPRRRRSDRYEDRPHRPFKRSHEAEAPGVEKPDGPLAALLTMFKNQEAARETDNSGKKRRERNEAGSQQSPKPKKHQAGAASQKALLQNPQPAAGQDKTALGALLAMVKNMNQVQKENRRRATDSSPWTPAGEKKRKKKTERSAAKPVVDGGNKDADSSEEKPAEREEKPMMVKKNKKKLKRAGHAQKGTQQLGTDSSPWTPAGEKKRRRQAEHSAEQPVVDGENKDAGLEAKPAEKEEKPMVFEKNKKQLKRPGHVQKENQTRDTDSSPWTPAGEKKRKKKIKRSEAKPVVDGENKDAESSQATPAEEEMLVERNKKRLKRPALVQTDPKSTTIMSRAERERMEAEGKSWKDIMEVTREKRRVRRQRLMEERHEEPHIHLTMISDRRVGAAAAMESVCRNTASPHRLRFHIIGPSSGDWQLEHLAPSCHNGGAFLRVYPLAEMVSRLERLGFVPIWTWDGMAQNTSKFTVKPPKWDYSMTHQHPFNLLRFYLPHIMPFRLLDKVLFMDDDVVILKDVATAWDYQLRENIVMSASCQNWVWSSCDRFESSTSYSYLDVPYFGFGRISGGRTLEHATCQQETDTECMPRGFLQLLRRVSVAINGPERPLTQQKLANTTAWNYGFNLFNLTAWRELNITDKYIQWMKLNTRYRLFPKTSLAYGLGIAMLTKVGHVQCFDEDTPVVQGLGFIGPKEMKNAGLSLDALKNSFGLHFNGPHKPWEPDHGNPYYQLYIEYAQDEVRQSYNQALQEQRRQVDERISQNRTSFLLLTDPRSGSEWIMEMLDHHPQICASGEADDGTVGFPREALIPSRYAKDHELLQSEQPFSMLDMSRTRVPRNYYTPSRPESVCFAKAGCSWGNMASLVWHVSSNKKFCDGNFSEWTEKGHRLGFGEHLATVCGLLGRAEEQLTRSQGLAPGDIDQNTLVSQVFQVYIRHQLQSSLQLGDVAYGHPDESKRLLPCRCPRNTLITGQKLMHDWLGELPERGKIYGEWTNRPWDINYNAYNASKKLSAPFYDLLGAMKDLGTRVILFERRNLLARFVSLNVAKETNAFHCTDPVCLENSVKAVMRVNVTRLRMWMRWTRHTHQRNRDWLRAAGIKTLELTYEDCVADAEKCLANTTAFLGVTPRTDLQGESTQIKLIDDLASRIMNLDEVRKALAEDGLSAWLE